MVSPRSLTLTGILLLIAGILGAGLIYWQAESHGAAASKYSDQAVDGDGDISLSPDDSKNYGRGVAMNMGEVGVLTDQFQRLSARWLQGKPLAFLVLIIALLAATACFKIADHLPTQNDQEPPSGPEPG